MVTSKSWTSRVAKALRDALSVLSRDAPVEGAPTFLLGAFFTLCQLLAVPFGLQSFHGSQAIQTFEP